MSKRPLRLRRCQLSVPGSSEKMMAKAAASNVDYVFLDLEDAVAPNVKVASRKNIIKALKELDWGKKTRCVRINDLTTQWAYEDIIEIVEEAGEYVDIIMIPKIMSGKDIYWVDTLLTQMEQKLGLKKRIGIEVLIEEVEAMINVEEVVLSSPRLEAIIFGMGDYSASQGVDVGAIGGDTDYPGDIWHYARNKIVIAARMAGIDAIDGPFANFKDPDGYRREAQRAAILGFTGKWAIHPAQIDIAQEVYSPTQEQVDGARRMVEAYREAEEQGLGAVALDGNLVDAASIRIMKNITTKADMIGM